MTARTSPEMIHAVKLMREADAAGQPITKYRAAKLAGVTPGGLRQSRLYREYMAEKETSNAKP